MLLEARENLISILVKKISGMRMGDVGGLTQSPICRLCKKVNNATTYLSSHIGHGVFYDLCTF